MTQFCLQGRSLSQTTVHRNKECTTSLDSVASHTCGGVLPRQHTHLACQRRTQQLPAPSTGQPHQQCLALWPSLHAIPGTGQQQSTAADTPQTYSHNLTAGLHQSQFNAGCVCCMRQQTGRHFIASKHATAAHSQPCFVASKDPSPETPTHLAACARAHSPSASTVSSASTPTH